MFRHRKHPPPINLQALDIRRPQFGHNSFILPILDNPILQEQQNNKKELMQKGDAASHELVDHYMLR